SGTSLSVALKMAAPAKPARPPRSASQATALAVVDHFVDQAVPDGFLGAHEAVAVGVLLDPVQRLAGVVGEDLLEAALEVEDLSRADLDVRGLSAEPGRPCLVDQDLRVRERAPLALGAGSEQHCAH